MLAWWKCGHAAGYKRRDGQLNPRESWPTWEDMMEMSVLLSNSNLYLLTYQCTRFTRKCKSVYGKDRILHNKQWTRNDTQMLNLALAMRDSDDERWSSVRWRKRQHSSARSETVTMTTRPWQVTDRTAAHNRLTQSTHRIWLANTWFDWLTAHP